MVGQFAVNARVQRRARLLQAGYIEIEHQRQHRRAFRVMHPLVIGFVIGASRRRHHRALAVTADDVVDDGAGLRDRRIAVGDDGRFAERMDLCELRRRQPGLGVALVALHLIGRTQLLQQPQNALRAGVVEVMKRQHGDFLRLLFGGRARFG